jgi:uncharacterized protein (DUF2235 family)
MKPHPKRSTSRELSDNPARVPTKQRLAICLDGTWNKQDSGTNVYQLSTLIARGDVGDGVQDVYYDPGVGTGLLDGLSGGFFGFGVSRNVREAYTWLVERYRDGDDIYVFGFSRGAFTARSLVGLIAKCGLLRRGAPISNEQLWRAYRILGRYRHERTGCEPARNPWERLAGRPAIPFRSIWLLADREPWDEDDQGIPVKPPENLTEKLLRRWSRRVKIQCLGVFDTVGSLGVDALAIPFLHNHRARFHDTHLTTLVVNGFQALAIDEHRANFVHNPWRRAVDPPAPPADSAPGDTAPGDTRHGGRIEQRWFIGAHSNVGGGYDDDVLAQRPLAWFVEESSRLGLVFRETPTRGLPRVADADCVPLLDPQEPPDPRPGQPRMSGTRPRVRDSYAEFLEGAWQHLIRSKREYRHIAPPRELRSNCWIQSVNEQLDASVETLRKQNNSRPGATPYLPPNLWEYLKRHEPGFSEPMPKHRYVGGGVSIGLLALWLALIGVAGWVIGAYVGVQEWVLAVLLPALALFADWRESVLNHAVTLEPTGRRARRRLAWMNAYLVVRIAAISAILGGLCFLFLWRVGAIQWPVRTVR